MVSGIGSEDPFRSRTALFAGDAPSAASEALARSTRLDGTLVPFCYYCHSFIGVVVERQSGKSCRSLRHEICLLKATTRPPACAITSPIDHPFGVSVGEMIRGPDY